MKILILVDEHKYAQEITFTIGDAMSGYTMRFVVPKPEERDSTIGVSLSKEQEYGLRKYLLDHP